MIAGINETNSRIKYISSKCRCKFDDRKCSSNQRWNNDVSLMTENVITTVKKFQWFNWSHGEQWIC